MAGLDFDSGLFDRNKRNLFGERNVSVGRPESALRVIMPGWAAIGSVVFVAGGIQNFRDNVGFVTNVMMVNESGATRNVTIVITNNTTSKTLISGNVDIGDGNGFTQSRYWSNDDIRPGDTVTIAIGNEGVGTAYVSETSYYSIPGVSFNATNGGVSRSTTGMRYDADASQTLTCPVLLPNGVTITKAIVYGNDNAEAWDLYRVLLTNASSLLSIGSQNLNSEDTISHTVDNSLYAYGFKTSTLDSSDDIDSARITFTQNSNPTSPGYYYVELAGVYGGQDESSE